MTGNLPSSRGKQPGTDGIWVLPISCLLIIASLGLTWLLALFRVWRSAATIPTRVTPQDWVVVLGKRLLGGAVTLEYAARLRRAGKLYKSHDCVRIMVLGACASL